MVLATAWMGRGDNARAMVCCRQIKRCRDASLRAQAQDLLTVKGRVLPPAIRERVTCVPDRPYSLSRPLSRRQDRHQHKSSCCN